MVYRCKCCGFLFHRYGCVRMCPACECPDLRPATVEESKQFYERLEGTSIRKGETV